jgi:hypothetical protein
MRYAGIALASAIVLGWPPVLEAWGLQAHRLVALIAQSQLTTEARQTVGWLLGDESLADVASWADRYEGSSATAAWHYVNIPPDARRYDRDRDCPRPATPPAERRDSRWRDCVIDRIVYNEERLADARAGRTDRATALKFLVHLVADVHQPFHAISTARGGNGIPVTAFGSATCGRDDRNGHPCSLHGLWDTTLIARRRLSDRRYLAVLERHVARLRGRPAVNLPAAVWAMESHALARAAMLPAGADAGEAYARAQLPVIDERLALGGLRLAAVLNRSLAGRRGR